MKRILIIFILIVFFTGCDSEMAMYKVEPNYKIDSTMESIIVDSKTLRDRTLLESDIYDTVSQLTHFTDEEHGYIKILDINNDEVYSLDSIIKEKKNINFCASPGDVLILSLPNSNMRYYWDIVNEVDSNKLKYDTRFIMKYIDPETKDINPKEIDFGKESDQRIVYIFNVGSPGELEPPCVRIVVGG